MTEENTPPDESPTNDAPEPADDTDKAYYVHTEQLDPARQLPRTAPYLDEELRRKAEVQRAKIEGREPDLDNPPATGSTTLVREDRLFDHPLNSLDPRHADENSVVRL